MNNLTLWASKDKFAFKSRCFVLIFQLILFILDSDIATWKTLFFTRAQSGTKNSALSFPEHFVFRIMWWRDKWNKIYAYPLSDWTCVIKYQVYDNCIVICTTQNIPKDIWRCFLFIQWLIYIARSGFQFRLQTKWLHCTMWNFSYCMESDPDFHPNCQIQEWDWNRNPPLWMQISPKCEHKTTVFDK